MYDVLRDEHSLTKELYDKMKQIHGAFLKDCCEEDESDYAREKRKTFHAIQEILTKTFSKDRIKRGIYVIKLKPTTQRE